MSLKYMASPVAIEQGLYIAYGAFAAMALISIAIGSFASLKMWRDPSAKKEAIKRQIGDLEDENADAPSELLSTQDAFLLPAYGSVVLLGLYHAFINLDKMYVNYTYTTYFCFLAVLSASLAGVSIINSALRLLGFKIELWQINLGRKSRELYSASFSIVHMVLLTLSICLAGLYVATNNWIVFDIFGIGLVIAAIQSFSLDSFSAGFTLLTGFFVYNIGWGYQNVVQSTVTRNLETSLKLLFPKMLFGLPAGQASQFALLGLDDVIIPGLFVALCLRYDQHKAGLRNPELGRSTGFRKPYFIACLIAYILGLGVFMYAEQVWASFPAYIYIAPLCTFSVLLTGAVRGELGAVFAYVSLEGQEQALAKRKAIEDKLRKRRTQHVPVVRRNPASKLPSVIREESHLPQAQAQAQATPTESST
ncbi:hypothetical protein BGW38_001801 [Lunasporangiospora selenospora]|uniref:Signal peptide peptidase-domain-containing protein n=1 Tax=Lunasporangiospora selenospora TaxID=979761 RepID=A0A9P6KE09_9FUNG|nr:hypothetical protein BGW38_001801 [Lunasporangiospora selenospora]